MTSVSDSLLHLEPHLPEALVSPAGRARLHVAAAALPAALTHCLYVECRAGGNGAADLIVDVDLDGAAVLADANPAIRLSGAQRADPHWAPVIAFARAWRRQDGPLGADIAGAWLEFDLAGPASPSGWPSLFIDFGDDVASGSSADRRLTVVQGVIAATNVALPSPVAGGIRRAIEALPGCASLLYMGIMLARGVHTVRLCIMGMSPDVLARYLVRIAWAGDLPRVRALVDAIALDGGQTQPAIVHLDVGASVQATLGLEYPLARVPQRRGEIAETAFLGYLEQQGLLATRERLALLEWIGLDERIRAHELWPSVIVRRVNHVKVVLRPEGAPAVKLYLCAESTPSVALRPAPPRGG